MRHEFFLGFLGAARGDRIGCSPLISLAERKKKYIFHTFSIFQKIRKRRCGGYFEMQALMRNLDFFIWPKHNC